MREFIMSEQDNSYIHMRVSEAMRDLSKVIFYLGYGTGRESEKGIDGVLRSEKVKLRWYRGYGSCTFLAFQYDSKPYHAYSDSYGDSRENEIRIFGNKQFLSKESEAIDVLITQSVEEMVRHFLPDSEILNHYGFCQSGSCSCDYLGRVVTPIAGRNVCDECIDKLSLAPRSVVPERETPKGKTEREKMNDGIRFNVLVRDNFTCRACGRSRLINKDLVLHVDHILPVSKGGKTEMKNLQTLCNECNHGKSDKWDKQIEMAFVQ